MAKAGRKGSHTLGQGITLHPVGEKEPKEGFTQGRLNNSSRNVDEGLSRERVEAGRPMGGCGQGPGEVEALSQCLPPALLIRQKVYSP